MENRLFNLLAVWASAGTSVIPVTPIQGITYRDAAMTAEEAEAGWPFRTIVDSAQINQYLYIIGMLLDQLDSQGLLSWSPANTYPAGSVVLGSNGVLYQCRAQTVNQDPTTNAPAIWQPVVGTHTILANAAAGNVAINLPASGRVRIIREDTAYGNTVTITPSVGGQTVCRQASEQLYLQDEVMTLELIGTNWYRV